MTLLTPPGFLQAGTYTAILDRMHLITAVTMRSAAVAQSGRQGFYPDRYPAYANPSGMDVVIGACAGIVENDFATNVGEYRFINPSNLTLTPAASSPTLNRNDILGFQVKDNFYDASGQNSIIPLILQGANSAGTPSDPAIPSSFIPVVRAVVNAGVTSPTLQDMRVKTAMSSGVLPVDSEAIRTAIGTPNAGALITRTDRNWLEQANPGGAWQVMSVPVVSSAANLTQITTPYADQLVIESANGMLYKRHGSNWIAVANMHPTGGGIEYTRATSQTITSGTVTKVVFSTAVDVDTSAVTVSGGSDFTLLRPGRWLLQANIPWATATTGNDSYWAWLGLSSNNAVRYALASGSNNDFFLWLCPSKAKRMAVNTAVSLYVYQDSGTNKDISIGQGDISINLTFMGA